MDGEHERRGADARAARARAPRRTSSSPSSGRAAGGPRPPRRRTAPARAARGGPARRPRGTVARPAGQQHAVLVLRERRGEGLQQRGRIVRHAACPAADQAAPVDPDPHACCPVTASPSTPAPPRAPSSAASSAGRASSPPGCRALRPGAYEVLRRARGSSHRAGHAWEQLVLPAPRRPRAGAAVPGQPRAARAPAQRDRDPRRRRAAPSRVVLARLRGLAAARSCRPWPVARCTS